MNKSIEDIGEKMKTLIRPESVLTQEEFDLIARGEMVPLPDVLIKDDRAVEAFCTYLKTANISVEDKMAMLPAVEKYIGNIDEQLRVTKEIEKFLLSQIGRVKFVPALASAFLAYITNNNGFGAMVFMGLHTVYRSAVSGVTEGGAQRKRRLEQIENAIKEAMRPPGV